MGDVPVAGVWVMCMWRVCACCACVGCVRDVRVCCACVRLMCV